MIVDYNEARDMALLAVDLPKLPREAPASAAVRPGSIYLGIPSSQLQVLQMLNPELGIVAPFVVQAPVIGETSIVYEIGGQQRIIERVLSQQNLTIPGGVSGAPVFSAENGAIVAMACAAADQLAQSFFVPLRSTKPAQRNPTKGEDNGQQISQLLSWAERELTRLGSAPNSKGVSALAWIQTRSAIHSLADSGVYDPKYILERDSLVNSLALFLKSDSDTAVLAGTSGVGKSSSVARILRTRTLKRPVLLLRAAQIRHTTDTLVDALLSALNITSFENVTHFDTASTSRPLVVVDGINELAIPGDWDSFTKNTLVPFATNIARRGWKLLFITREDRLDELTELSRSLKLYEPNPALKAENKARFPFIAIEGFSRDEFDTLVSLHGLPANLPFSDLRHPIVFRLMVEANKGKKLEHVRIRTLLSLYIDEVIRKIHFRCSKRSRDRIRGAIQEWTESDKVTHRGFLPIGVFEDTDDEELAEAAVSESLLERVPGGYRYVYDEIFDFVVSPKIARFIKSRLDESNFSLITIVNNLSTAGTSAGAIARCLELLSEHDPEIASLLAERLVQELNGLRPLSESITAPNSIRTLFPLMRVLGSTEKGGPLDLAKDALPLFDEAGSEFDTTWNGHFSISYALSDDHISYAFDDDRMWRMIKLAAFGRPREGSYPFRSKDVGSSDGIELARHQIDTLSQYKVVRHFLTVSPTHAQERFLNGLEDQSRIGSEHSFSSFCAQIIYVFLEKFDFGTIVRGLAKSRSSESFNLFLKLTKAHPRLIFPYIKNGDLLNAPELTSRSLAIITSTSSELKTPSIKLAFSMVSVHNHPIFAYSTFFSNWASQDVGVDLLPSILAAWDAGDGTEHEIALSATSGLLSLDRVLELLASRLNTQSGERNRLGFYISSLEDYWKTVADDDKRLDIVDKVVRVFWATRAAKTIEQIFAIEVLLHWSLSAGAIRGPLLGVLESSCKEFPTEVGFNFRYVIRDRARRLDEVTRDNLLAPIFSNASWSSIAQIVGATLRARPESADSVDLVRRAIARFGARHLFERVVEDVRRSQELDFLLDDEAGALIQILSEVDPEMFEEYREIFDSAPATISADARKDRRR
ncbi:hypothetical protein JQ603_07180 [Bradyrhizobium liaoningense]|nr:hypothetical protein [Bradyrhizobium liaoningense]MBR0706267.1 hypothetical protein [Bradyrhizobium liaoningense]